MEERWACAVCHIEKEATEYGPFGAAQHIYHSVCNGCRAAIKERKEAAPSGKVRYVVKHALSRRDWRIRYTYGISALEYDNLLQHQQGKCAICGQQEYSKDRRTGHRRRLAVDHNHENGMVRGLLCQKCNLGISYFRENPDRLAKAADYIRHPPSLSAPDPMAFYEERQRRMAEEHRKKWEWMWTAAGQIKAPESMPRPPANNENGIDPIHLTGIVRGLPPHVHVPTSEDFMQKE